MIAELIGYKGDIKWDISHLDGTPRKLLDISKIQATGWNYKIELRSGLISTIQDYIEDFKNNKVRK